MQLGRLTEAQRATDTEGRSTFAGTIIRTTLKTHQEGYNWIHMNTLKDKVILITGAGQGLGAATCEVLASDQATLILTDIRTEGIQAIEERCVAAGCKSKSFRMDVGDEDSVTATLAQVVKEFGKIDVIINNAGIDYTKSVEELALSEWDAVMRVNLRGPFIVSKAAFPYLKENGGGHIVNIVSTASKRAWANASPYHASKWGLLGFSHALHVEGRKENIKVTAVIAGGMKTPFLLDRFPDIDTNLLQDPKNVADTIRYVISMPAETVIPEVMVLPMTETSWP
ncbi:NADP-dependent 3-hydroxy acid dehydrogenase YdfG [Sphingobacterium allocomposti]|uniref:NADP-dependent 3-hydroxy acid dehydrogenase YdfG n=2 Tax=Sphingobacterium allocomposti TaxID=415956 RepID=A0A5S5D4M0_9SPHI|nr:NADP-dependent 3-hydroxy acid dehydrogenase YdfG [Sphingobacterium composti Yoo et al. 2007 non Ten et al. 2007]